MLREKKKMREKEELRRLEAIASGMSYEKVLAIEVAQKADENPASGKTAAVETADIVEEEAVHESAVLLEEAIEERRKDEE